MKRVLIIDDNQEIVALIQGTAERLGYVAAILSDTSHFMTTFVRFRPDIVTLDIVMPAMDGIEIIRWLTDVDYTGRLIIISGYADFNRMAGALADARGSMVVNSLPKPFRTVELEAALRGTPA